ncbi:bifunctional riboflavin kinase/FAD synthetase [Kingella kingae]|uniref:Riboflavin biosynthesis protein n=2 Tax=Kingella kingae TaxID=504 RepID=F5S9T6_KINKI|nr:bifunctional riboflavin kinase/FAD synthetase [Kingella kingae]EGK06916.1 riboflavin biosynthesis protein RibF [Kingella kingae ATCC 23330]MDK4533778.1 bifunctional riboflavin kinase/FAD synthetase [Kingella kingae]MDK4540248.1 bifunctional riboflavin kinase/FAD synthetase [Kingella kingae]MDK4544099.1 bifunctional riboflavin kinase/FAD synthetase [Kingella kingae]MDK4552779.1 bifunctional riboflavin kinase/FAD synthetase [Kingella kingae]
MKIWLGQSAPYLPQGSAVTIGNFDGVHTGHRHILNRLATEAAARNLPAIAIVFEPQPAEFFAQQARKTAPSRLSPLRDKLQLLAQTSSLHGVWVQRFNPTFANTPADVFTQTVLRERLNTRYLLVGDDFRFGKARGGDFDLLCAQSDFVTENTPSILIAGERASSTAVRQALAAGNLPRAEQILGHGYTLSGRVKHGAKLGRTIGCPTANIHLSNHAYALQGVFVVEATGAFGRRAGVASFGRNPTVSHTPEAKLEVHLFDFAGDLYGERLHIRFLHKLRDEERFADLSSLQTQIAADMQAAKIWYTQSR